MAGELTTRQKLDMALSDLPLDRSDDGRGRAGGRRRGLGYQERDRSRERREPHGRRDRFEDRGGGGKGSCGKGSRRMPPEQKALLNTRCFFNDDGDFVVRLHDTDVFVLQRGPELAEVVKPEGDEPEPDAAEAKPEPKAENGAAQEEGATSKEAGGEEKAQEGCQSEATQEKAADRTPPGEEPKAAAAAEGAPEAGKLAAEAEPAEPPEKKARTDGGEAADAPASEAPKAAEAPGLSAEPGAEPGPGTKDASRAEAKEPKVEEKADEGNAVIVLTSGKFRTAETKFIINEALHAFSISVDEDGDSFSDWRLRGESVPTRIFEDGMRLRIKTEVRPSELKSRLEERIRSAQESAGRSRDGPHGGRRGTLPPPPPGPWGPPPYGWPGAYPGGYLPHPQWGPPPPGWRPHGPPPWAGGPPWDAAHGPPRLGEGPGAPRPGEEAPPRPADGGGPRAAAPRPAAPLPDDMFQ